MQASKKFIRKEAPSPFRGRGWGEGLIDNSQLLPDEPALVISHRLRSPYQLVNLSTFQLILNYPKF